MLDKLALSPLLTASWETIYMVFLSSLIAIILGLIVGVVLFAVRPEQFWRNKLLYSLLSGIVNIGRSIPFIILLVASIPLTRLIVGTSIGTQAAIIPLAIAAIPFYARIVESTLLEVPAGLIEAAHAMGSTPIQIIFKFLLPESLSSLINGGTLTVIGLIGYSAMAGAIGGGGLGELAINYGYQRFDTTVMIETIVVLVVLVQGIQWLGDYFAKTKNLKAIVIFTFSLLIATFTYWGYKSFYTQTDQIKVGIISGEQQQVMAIAKKVAWQQYHLKLQPVIFEDYVQPNAALSNGDIDANIFQHLPYLQAQIKAHHYPLTTIGKTFVYPMGFYSKKIKSIADLNQGAIIAIPNDPSNESRALHLLANAGLIQFKNKKQLFVTLHDIKSNPKHLRFKTLQNAQLPRVFKDATLVALTNDYITPTGLTVDQALIKEGADSPYANIIAVRIEDKNNPQLHNLVKIMQSEAVIDATMKAYPHGGAIPAFNLP